MQGSPGAIRSDGDVLQCRWHSISLLTGKVLVLAGRKRDMLIREFPFTGRVELLVNSTRRAMFRLSPPLFYRELIVSCSNGSKIARYVLDSPRFDSSGSLMGEECESYRFGCCKYRSKCWAFFDGDQNTVMEFVDTSGVFRAETTLTVRDEVPEDVMYSQILLGCWLTKRYHIISG